MKAGMAEAGKLGWPRPRNETSEKGGKAQKEEERKEYFDGPDDGCFSRFKIFSLVFRTRRGSHHWDPFQIGRFIFPEAR